MTDSEVIKYFTIDGKPLDYATWLALPEVERVNARFAAQMKRIGDDIDNVRRMI